MIRAYMRPDHIVCAATRCDLDLMHPVALVAAIVACFFFITPASAQDRAAVGGNNDPALVGSNATRASSSADIGSFSRAEVTREASIDNAEALLKQVRSQIGGTAIEAPRDDEPLGTGRQGRELNSALRYRDEVETMVREHWDQLGPLTRDLYSANYNRSNPDDNSQRYRSPYGDNGKLENKLLGATDDVQGAMQNLEDLLLPMLKDLKQGFDDGLRQQRFNQR